MTCLKAVLALAALPGVAAAEPLVRDCDSWIASARNLSIPYEDAIREYGNGEVAVMSMAVDEPACCGAHLMVLYPEFPDEPFRACRIVTTPEEMGWGRLDLAETVSAYDPSIGLILSIPASVFDGQEFQPFTLRVVINRATGTVTATEEP